MKLPKTSIEAAASFFWACGSINLTGGIQMAEAPMIKTFRSGATGLILSLCNEIKLVEHINHSVTWDENQLYLQNKTIN